MASAINSVLLVKQQSTEVANEKGFEVAYSYDYQSQGETGWANFVREMKDKDVKVLEFIGQPQNLVELTNEMGVANWHPEVILLSANFYDDLYRQAAATEANATYIGGQTLFLRGSVRRIFFDWLRAQRPELLERYERLYAKGAYLQPAARREIEEAAGAPWVRKDYPADRFRHRRGFRRPASAAPPARPKTVIQESLF